MVHCFCGKWPEITQIDACVFEVKGSVLFQIMGSLVLFLTMRRYEAAPLAPLPIIILSHLWKEKIACFKQQRCNATLPRSVFKTYHSSFDLTISMLSICHLPIKFSVGVENKLEEAHCALFVVVCIQTDKSTAQPLLIYEYTILLLTTTTNYLRGIP